MTGQPMPGASAQARTEQYVARLNAGGRAPQPLGPLTQLAVQKGDTIQVSAPGFYPQRVNGSFAFSLLSFVSGLLQPSPNTPPASADGHGHSSLPLLQVGLSAGLAAVPQLGGGVPKAYLRVLFFTSDSVLVAQRTVPLSQVASTGYETLQTGLVPITQDGYVTIYVGNESPVDVFFDDIAIEHRQGLQVQENQYDPWGLSLAGVDYSSSGMALVNKYQFNGKERQLDLGLAWSHYGARFYDGQLGRWHSVDASSEKYINQSSYHYAGNNPVKFSDFDGNDYGVNVNRDNRTLTITAHFLTSAQSSKAFQRNGSDRWNAQSGATYFIAGGVKALKHGHADAYRVFINVSSEVSGSADGQGRYSSDRDNLVKQNKSGVVNSFDVEKTGFVEHQRGGTSNNQVDVLAGSQDSGTTTHEVNHAMGIAHTTDGGSQVPSGDGVVGKAEIAESLKGVGIGGDNAARNSGDANSSIGDGTLLNNSSNKGLENGQVISARRYERIMNRLEKRGIQQ